MSQKRPATSENEETPKRAHVELGPLQRLPDLVLDKIYERCPQGVPENLRLTCSRLRESFFRTEGVQRLKPLTNPLTVWMHLKDKCRVFGQQNDITKFHFCDVSSQRAMKVARLAKNLNICIYNDCKLPPFLSTGTDVNNTFKQLLNSSGIEKVTIFVMGSLQYYAPVSDLIPEKITHSLIVYYLPTIGDLETFQKINSQISVYICMEVPTALLHQILSSNKNLQTFLCKVTKDIREELKKYVEEWQAGGRTIKRWFFEVPSGNVPIVENKETFTRHVNGSNQSLYLSFENLTPNSEITLLCSDV